MERARRQPRALPHRHRLGRLAEAIAADYFFAAGFVAVGANVRAGPLELDLLIERDDLLVVVEVRARKRHAIETALQSVRPKKQAQIRRAIEGVWRRWLQSRTHLERVRYDVVTVAFEGTRVELEHIESAFD